MTATLVARAEEACCTDVDQAVNLRPHADEVRQLPEPFELEPPSRVHTPDRVEVHELEDEDGDHERS